MEPQSRRWTREEYYQMAERGFFHDQRVELIEGEILMMSPQKWRHSKSVARTTKTLERILGSRFWVRSQLPLAIGPDSEPEPDVSVVAGSLEDYSDHPTTALLVVEVSDASLDFDRREKASLYAKAGVQDYWVLNLVDLQLEVFRDPTADASLPFGFGYAGRSVCGQDDSIAPLAAPAQTIQVAELLP